MQIEIDDDFSQDIVRAELKHLYKSLKYKKGQGIFSWDEAEEKEAIKEMRRAIQLVHNWYATVDQYI